MGQSTMQPAPWRNERQRAARREEKRRARERKAASMPPKTCPTCSVLVSGPRAYCSPGCRPSSGRKYVPTAKAKAAHNARRRHRENARRATASDITPEQELAMRRKARKCPLCGVFLTSKPNLPNSKHLDHIVPVNVGGTHTHGNVRIVCAACNLKRPKDGSDYTGPVTLWAQGDIPVGRADRRSESMRQRMTNTVTCRKGLHSWTAENIKVMPDGKRRCAACDEERQRVRNPLRPCARCGTPAALPGSQAMCPACIDAAARKAIELHKAGGLSWNQIAAMVGYGSGTGIWYAAKRIGYTANAA